MRFVNRFRGPIGLLSAWLLVVAVGSAVVWTVISHAGDELVASASPSLQAATPTPTEVDSATPTPTPQEPQETRKPTLIKSKSPTPSPTPATPSLTPESVDETTPSPSTAVPSPEQPSNDPSDDGDRDGDDGKWDDDGDDSPPPLIRATWQGAGGLVIAECQGWAISLVGAPADSGYHVEVWSSGPRRIRVNFEVQDGSGARTEVFGACYRGNPKFFARPGDDSDGDGVDVNE